MVSRRREGEIEQGERRAKSKGRLGRDERGRRKEERGEQRRWSKRDECAEGEREEQRRGKGDLN